MGDENDKPSKSAESRPSVCKLRAQDVPTIAVSESDKLARESDARVSAKEEAKWRALFASGLINLESVPVPREELKWSKCDDVEVRVLLRARAGTKLALMLVDATYSREQVVGAICRLVSRRLLQIR